MRSLFVLVAITVAGLCIVAASIAGGDRSTLVPPPEAVAESFARELAQGNYALAARYLSSARRTSIGRNGLQAWFDRSRRRLGHVKTVEGTLERTGDSHAAARTTIEARFGTAVLHLEMIREHGLWKIDGLPSGSQ